MALLRDLSTRTRIRLTGQDRVRFLHGMITNDVQKLTAGQGCYAAMLTPKGKMQTDAVVYCDPDALELEMEPEVRERILQTLGKHLILDEVELVDLTGQEPAWALYGDDAESIVRGLGFDALPAAPYHHIVKDGRRVARTDELTLPGFHVFGMAPPAGENIVPLDGAEFEELRIEAGTPRYGADMGEDRLPLEAGLAERAISFDKGCYLGQEVIARATNLGHIHRKLVGLWVDGVEPVRAGAKLGTATKPEAGVVTSSVRSRRLGRVLALGYLHQSAWAEGTEVAIRDREGAPRVAHVASLPFKSLTGLT